MTLAFDHVLVEVADGPDRRMSADEFLELPLDQRVQLIVGGKLTFLRGQEVVQRLEALRSLRS